MTDRHDTEALLRRALTPEELDPALLGRVKASMRKEQDMRTSKHTKRVISLALAAALLLALSVTAYAAMDGGEWFKSWFSDQTEGELTEGQMDYIDEAAADIGQSVTADGWTVTLESAMTDSRRVYMKLSIQAEDGTGTARNPMVRGMLASTDPDAPEAPFSGSGSIYPLGKTEGVFSQMMVKSVRTGLEQGSLFSHPLRLTLNQLTDGPEADEKLLGEGPWVFEFTLTPAEDWTVELIDEPIVCRARYAHLYLDGEPYDPAASDVRPAPDGGPVQVPVEVEYEDVDVTVTSLRLFSTGAVLTYVYDGEADPRGGPDIGRDLRVTLADGSEVTVVASDGGWKEELQARVMSMEFAVPIVLDEVTAVSFQGRELPLPAR